MWTQIVDSATGTDALGGGGWEIISRPLLEPCARPVRWNRMGIFAAALPFSPDRLRQWSDDHTPGAFQAVYGQVDLLRAWNDLVLRVASRKIDPMAPLAGEWPRKLSLLYEILVEGQCREEAKMLEEMVGLVPDLVLGPGNQTFSAPVVGPRIYATTDPELVSARELYIPSRVSAVWLRTCLRGMADGVETIGFGFHPSAADVAVAVAVIPEVRAVFAPDAERVARHYEILTAMGGIDELRRQHERETYGV